MKSYKPTSASRRAMTNVDYAGLSKGEPHKPLLMKLKSRGGRNNQGRITMRHQGGGNAKLYRMVDFGQIEFLNVPGKVETLEYDPYRTAFIAKVSYKGAYRYILAPDGLKVGDIIITAESASLRTGNRLKLKNIPVGQQIHNVELTPGKGG